MQDIQTVILGLIDDLSPRQKTVLAKRFSLDGKSKRGMTLAQLGEKYGVPRERIRQIEEAAFGAVRKKIAAGAGREVFGYLREAVDNQGSVRKEDGLMKEVEERFGIKLQPLQLRFLLEADGSFGFYSEDKDFYDFWHRGPKALSAAKGLIDKTHRHLAQKKEEVLANKNFGAILPVLAKYFNVSDAVGLNYLAISKKFGVNQYGDFGLMEWPEINPKTVRDRAYLILKDAEKPLHFRDIADFIKERRFDGKSVHASTVHNELIKDGRFVLVGRGIYALAEHGFTPGAAREVIQRILKESGPLHPKNLVQLVLKERLFKENTVLLNLQNKKLFKRLSDGRYHVSQA